MYFLQQIKSQFTSCVISYADDSAGSNSQGTQTTSLSIDEVDFDQLNEMLDAINNDKTFPATVSKTCGSFLEKVRDGKYEGLNTDDAEYQQMLQLYTRNFTELKEMKKKSDQMLHIVESKIKKENIARGV